MLLPRIIPCLLIKDNALYKTIAFDNPKYIGDPINAVRIFNEKKVDELIVLDISASVKGQEPNINLISDLASECRMPLCYGGGIKNINQIQKIISLGVEKVSISSAAINNCDILKGASDIVGNQSIVVTIDVKKIQNEFIAYINNGTINTGKNIVELIEKFQNNGVGEIVINSIDNDGLMNGFNFDLINKTIEFANIPLTFIGGAGSLNDIKLLFKKYGLVGAGVGSLFIFKGPYRAVLINYPPFEKKIKLLTK